jgi:hypothetical protein
MKSAPHVRTRAAGSARWVCHVASAIALTTTAAASPFLCRSVSCDRYLGGGELLRASIAKCQDGAPVRMHATAGRPWRADLATRPSNSLTLQETTVEASYSKNYRQARGPGQFIAPLPPLHHSQTHPPFHLLPSPPPPPGVYRDHQYTTSFEQEEITSVTVDVGGEGFDVSAAPAAGGRTCRLQAVMSTPGDSGGGLSILPSHMLPLCHLAQNCARSLSPSATGALWLHGPGEMPLRPVTGRVRFFKGPIWQGARAFETAPSSHVVPSLAPCPAYSASPRTVWQPSPSITSAA